MTMVSIWRGINEVPDSFGPTAVTIGNFDGVHRGHQHLLETLAGEARLNGGKTVAVTFDPHPSQVHRPDAAPVLIMSPEERIAALGRCGVDAVLVIHYTLEFAQQSPEEFVKNIFVDGLQAQVVVVGGDAKFGRGNTGDVGTLRELGSKYNFAVTVVEEFTEKESPQHSEPDALERRCSSTWVREALSRGEVFKAAEILGRPHSLRSVLVHDGVQGSAAVATKTAGQLPARGSYLAWMLANDRRQLVSLSITAGTDGVEDHVEVRLPHRVAGAVFAGLADGLEVDLDFIERFDDSAFPKTLLTGMHEFSRL